jgi:hypothetical protein
MMLSASNSVYPALASRAMPSPREAEGQLGRSGGDARNLIAHDRASFGDDAGQIGQEIANRVDIRDQRIGRHAAAMAGNSASRE